MKPRIDIHAFTLLGAFILFFISPTALHADPKVYGILPESYASVVDNAPVVHAEKPVMVTLFGIGVDEITTIGFAVTKRPPHSSCDHERVTGSFKVIADNPSVATSVITLRELARGEEAFYLCVGTDIPSNMIPADQLQNSNVTSWSYAGAKLSDPLLFFYTTHTLMPVWVQVILIIVLFFLSGLFSGLNLGLMSLDKTELKIIESAGAPDEKIYAKAIRPVREKGNLLLCTLLLGNVLVNTSLTILMDDLTGSGLYAVIASTIGITLFGEIMPQAVCSRHGLAVGARTLWLTKFFMVLTFPIAFPVSFLLDKILGEEMGQVYSREKLGVLIREQVLAGTVAADELNIITGALTLTTKSVADVMTPLDKAFMISYSDVLDFHSMNSIYSNGYSRIPVYEKDRQTIRAVLNVKDLAFVNTVDRVPVSTICDFYQRSPLVVLDSTSLESMLKEFRQGRTHMALVERLVTEGAGDPYREMVGLVTLEDVIEEIIQAEIVDETDMQPDNTHRQQRKTRQRDFRLFTLPDRDGSSHLPPSLKIAALRHLASSVSAFDEKLVSYSVLQSFLNAEVVHDYLYNPDDENILFSPTDSANYALLILQGRASVYIGREGLMFETGPFTMFGETVLKRVNALFPDPTDGEDADMKDPKQRLAEALFTPDYTLRAVSNVQYVRITAEQYLLLRRLSMFHYGIGGRATNLRPSIGQSTHDVPGCGIIQLGTHDMFQTAWDNVNRRRDLEAARPHPLEPADNNQSRSRTSMETVSEKRSQAFAPNSGDVLASEPGEIEAFVPQATTTTTSVSNQTGDRTNDTRV